MVVLGVRHLQSRDGPRDLAGAELWFRKAARLGQRHAFICLVNPALHAKLGEEGAAAELHHWRKRALAVNDWVALISNAVTPSDFDEVMRRAKAAAANSDARASTLAGVIHLRRGERRRAIEYLQRGYRLGDLEAGVHWSRLQLEESGSRDLRGVVAMCRDAAEAWHPKGMFLFGRLCLEGQGRPKDKARALVWLTRAAQNGVLEAAYLMAKSHPDPAQRMSWLRQAAGLKHPASMCELGLILINRKSLLSAAALTSALELVAEGAPGSKDPRVWMTLGLAWFTGRGFPKDLTRAAQCFRQASELGDAAGHQAWGHALFSGKEGVPRDLTKSIEVLKRAVEGGRSHSYWILSKAVVELKGQSAAAEAWEYLELGVAKGNDRCALELAGLLAQAGRTERLRKLYTLAAQGGLEEAIVKLADCLLDGVGGPVQPQRGLKILLNAAGSKSSKASLSLARRFEEGRGLPKDLEKALVHYRAAASAEPEARKALERLGAK
jgi:TPR repeat protein